MAAAKRPAEHERLSVVIVTMNSSAFIRACLRSVVDQDAPFPVEVIVVDNASADDTVEIVRREFPAVTLLPSAENTGFSAGNNLGIRASSGDVVLLLNPDTIVHPMALSALMRSLTSDAGAAGVGPKILNGDGTLQRTGVAFPSLWNVFCESIYLDKVFPRSRMFGRHRRLYENPETSTSVEYLQGSCLMLRKNIIEEAGLLDEGYFMYFEEADLCYRLHRLGWKIRYEPSASITHFGGSGAAFYDAVRLSHYHRSYMRYLKKHEGRIRRLAFRVLLLVRAIIRSLTFFFGSILADGRRKEYRERCLAYLRVTGILARRQ